MAEDVKNEIPEKISIQNLLQEINEEFKSEKDDRWDEAVKFMFSGYLVCLLEGKFKRFLEEKGWSMEELEEEANKYMESLFPEV